MNVQFFISQRTNLLHEIITQKKLFNSEMDFLKTVLKIQRSINYFQGYLLRHISQQ